MGAIWQKITGGRVDFVQAKDLALPRSPARCDGSGRLPEPSHINIQLIPLLRFPTPIAFAPLSFTLHDALVFPHRLTT